MSLARRVRARARGARGCRARARGASGCRFECALTAFGSERERELGDNPAALAASHSTSLGADAAISCAVRAPEQRGGTGAC